MERIQERIGAEESTDWAATIKTQIQDSITQLILENDWKDLQRKTTITYTASEYCDVRIKLPADVDRILIIKPTNDDDQKLIEVTPLVFEDYKALYKNPSEPWLYATADLDRSSTTSIPQQVIELWPEPEDGATFYLWYIVHIDEISNWDEVPKLPVHLWKLVQMHATKEILVLSKQSSRIVEFEALKYNELLAKILQRESLGTNMPQYIRPNQPLLRHKVRRMRKL